MVSTSVNIGGGITLKNPILTASGTFGYGLEFAPFQDLNELGGFIVKGTTPTTRQSLSTDGRDDSWHAQLCRTAE